MPDYFIIICRDTLTVNFTITSWKTCPETDSRTLADGIRTAMRDMKKMMEDQQQIRRSTSVAPPQKL